MPDEHRTWTAHGFMEAVAHPFFQNTLDHILVVADKHGRIMYLNDAMVRAFGYGRDELLGKHFWILFPGGQQHDMEKQFRQAWQGEVATNFTIAMCHKQGRLLYVNWVTSKLTDSQGEPVYLVGAGTDITDYRQTLIDLDQSSKRFRNLVEASSDWIWESDAEMRFTYSSPQLERLLGYRTDEILGRHLHEIMPPEEIPRVERLLVALSPRAPVTCLETVMLHRDGRRIVTESSVIPFCSDDGDLEGYRGITRDITERWRIRQALAESERRLKLGQQSARAGSWEWDIQTGKFYWSDQVWSLFGIRHRTSAPRYEEFIEYIHPRDRQSVTDAMQNALECGHYDVDHRVRWPDGSVHWLRVTGSVEYDQEGRAIRMLGVVMDIDQRKHDEEERHRQAELQRNLLIREVHHRIKNNLQGIIGLLRDNLAGDETLEPIVEKTISQIRSIALIHGVYGRRDGNDLLLCELLPALVQVHATSGARISYRSLLQQPLGLGDRDAVPAALIINELLLNAIKHRTSLGRDTIPVRVRFITFDGIAHLTILCPGGQLPSTFDFAAGKGLGTGLELVRALMPPKGMEIQYVQREMGVMTRVNFCPPFVKLNPDAENGLPCG